MQFDLQVGVGTLVVAKPLDAEVQSVYNMTIQVTDGTNFATAQVRALFFNLLCTGTAFSHTPDPHQIKLLLPLPGGAVCAQLPSLLRSHSLFFWKLSLADYEMCFFVALPLTFPVLPLSWLAYSFCLVRGILDISGLMGLTCANKGQVFV